MVSDGIKPAVSSNLPFVAFFLSQIGWSLKQVLYYKREQENGNSEYVTLNHTTQKVKSCMSADKKIGLAQQNIN